MDDIMDDFRDAMQQDQQNRFRQFANKPDWIYRDVPFIPDHLLEEFTVVIGSSNIHWIQQITIEVSGGTLTFGRAMFSPEAVTNVAAWMKENPGRRTVYR